MTIELLNDFIHMTIELLNDFIHTEYVKQVESNTIQYKYKCTLTLLGINIGEALFAAPSF
jgi:hypothetical protein